MRMELGGRPSRNALNTECFRWRGKFTMISWHDTPTPGAAGITAEVLRSLTTAQRATNSTRGSTPGLIDPSVGEQGGRIPLPNPPRPVRRSGVPTANGNNVIGQNNLAFLATGPPQAGNLGFGHSNGHGVHDLLLSVMFRNLLMVVQLYDTNHQSLTIPQNIAFGDDLGSSVMVGPSGPMNTYGVTTPMPCGSSYQPPHHSSLAQYSQHDVSMGLGQRAAIGTFHNDSASANYIVGGIISSTRSSSSNRSVLGVPTSFQPLDEGSNYDQGRQFRIPSHPILPGVPKRSHDSGESDVQDPRPFKRPRVVQNSSSAVLNTPWSNASTLRPGPRVRHNGPATQFHGDFTSQTFTPELRRHVQQYTSNSTFYQGSPEQTLSKVTDQEGPSELSGFPRHWDPTMKRRSHARASRSSTYLSLPIRGHENIHEQQDLNANPDSSFGDILSPTDAAQAFEVGLAFDYSRGSSNTWTSERGSRADFGGARNSTSHRIDCTENEQQPAMHHPTDRVALDAATRAWLAADGGWDEFPMSVGSETSTVGQHDAGGSVRQDGVLNTTSRQTRMSASATTGASTVSQHEELHNQPDTVFTNSSTRNGIPCPATGDASPQSHQSQHGTANLDGLDYLFNNSDEDDI